MRIGLFLQDLANVNWEKRYNEVIKLCKKAELDLLVFPENTYCPKMDELEECYYFDDNDEGYGIIKDFVCDLSKNAGCAVLFCHFSKEDYIYSFYANEFSEDGETYNNDYCKHTATWNSPLDGRIEIDDPFFGYDFNIINLKNFKIGQTICYDSTFPLFSRMYGLNNVDILINSTGGHVDYKKWSYYQKVRAIENNCFNLCIMANMDNSRKNESYVFAYNKYGRKLPLTIVDSNGSIKKVTDNSIKDALYVFDIEKNEFNWFWENKYEDDEFLNQKATKNKNVHAYISVKRITEMISSSNKLAPNLYCVPKWNYNLILCLVHGKDILIPEKVAELEYNDDLKKIDNKRYLIVNMWDEPVKSDFYNGVLSNILKVRTVENYSALFFYDGAKELCLQTGKNKNVQVVAKEFDGSYSLDFDRMTGPEAIWRTSVQTQMRAEWREGYEDILKYILKNKK